MALQSRHGLSRICPLGPHEPIPRRNPDDDDTDDEEDESALDDIFDSTKTPGGKRVSFSADSVAKAIALTRAIPDDLEIISELTETYIYCPHSLLYHTWPAPKHQPDSVQLRAINADYNALLRECKRERERDYHEAFTLKEVLMDILSSTTISYLEAHKTLTGVTARLMLLLDIKAKADSRRTSAEAVKAFDDANHEDMTSTVHLSARKAAMRAIQTARVNNRGKATFDRRYPATPRRGPYNNNNSNYADGTPRGRRRFGNRSRQMRQRGDRAWQRANDSSADEYNDRRDEGDEDMRDSNPLPRHRGGDGSRGQANRGTGLQQRPRQQQDSRNREGQRRPRGGRGGDRSYRRDDDEY